MTDNLRALALSLDESAPDRKIAAIMQRERTKIEEALKTVGEYVLSDDEGRIYIITASQNSAESAAAAATSSTKSAAATSK
jgi:hypothetical protein